MIKLFLSLLGLIVIAYGAREWRQSRLVGFALVVCSVAAGILVWFPVLSDRLAHVAGVGRGADMILYCYSAISFIIILNLGLKQRDLHRSITQLARHIAISNPERKYPVHQKDSSSRI